MTAYKKDTSMVRKLVHECIVRFYWRYWWWMGQMLPTPLVQSKTPVSNVYHMNTGYEFSYPSQICLRRVHHINRKGWWNIVSNIVNMRAGEIQSGSFITEIKRKRGYAKMALTYRLTWVVRQVKQVPLLQKRIRL